MKQQQQQNLMHLSVCVGVGSSMLRTQAQKINSFQEIWYPCPLCISKGLFGVSQGLFCLPHSHGSLLFLPVFFSLWFPLPHMFNNDFPKSAPLAISFSLYLCTFQILMPGQAQKNESQAHLNLARYGQEMSQTILVHWGSYASQ